MKLSLRSIASGNSILSGSLLGRKVFADFIAQAPPVENPTVVFLDFEGVEVATSSFLRESVLAFRDTCSQSLVNLYPVVANANESVLEELQFYLRERSDAIWCCQVDEDGMISNPKIIGWSKLEDGQRQTLEYVKQLKRASAPMLFKENDAVQATGWNNRLSALAAKRLLIERREGKSKVFSTVLEHS